MVALSRDIASFMFRIESLELTVGNFGLGYPEWFTDLHPTGGPF
jgi:hypothetical protein